MTDVSHDRRAVIASAVIGVGLSGFFDGILLHQVLQWHHLLSLVPGDNIQKIETQILADGLFHVLMYIVTAIGLYLLWRGRKTLADRHVTWRTVAGGGLLGFGLWNLIDVGLFHWILGIHRIRVNVPDPMTYDVGWLAILGLLPMVGGWLLLRAKPSGGEASGRAGATFLTLLALVAAPIASLPVPNSRTAVVLFGSNTPPTVAYMAAVSAGVPVMWINGRSTIMAVELDQPGATARLYKAGALLVTRSPALAGCAAALRS